MLIWQSNDVVTLEIAKNVYGFSLAFAGGFNQIQPVKDSGFEFSNIMVGIGDPSTAPNPNLYDK